MHAREVADRVVFMGSGKVVEEGHPAEIFENPRHERTHNFLRRILEKCCEPRKTKNDTRRASGER